MKLEEVGGDVVAGGAGVVGLDEHVVGGRSGGMGGGVSVMAARLPARNGAGVNMPAPSCCAGGRLGGCCVGSNVHDE